MKTSQKTAMMATKVDPRSYGKKKPYDGGPGYSIDRFVAMMPSACAIRLPLKYTSTASWASGVVPVSFRAIKSSATGVLIMASGPNRGEDDVIFRVTARDAMAASMAGVGEVQEVLMAAAKDALAHIRQNHELFWIMEGNLDE